MKIHFIIKSRSFYGSDKQTACGHDLDFIYGPYTGGPQWKRKTYADISTDDPHAVTCKSCKRSAEWRTAAGVPAPISKSEAKTPKFIHLKDGQGSACKAVTAQARDFWLVEDPQDVTCVKCKGTEQFKRLWLSPEGFEAWLKAKRAREPKIHMANQEGHNSICSYWPSPENLTTDIEKITCSYCLRHKDLERMARIHAERRERTKALVAQIESAPVVKTVLARDFSTRVHLPGGQVEYSKLMPPWTAAFFDADGKIIGVAKMTV